MGGNAGEGQTSEARFEFGKNWARLLTFVGDKQIEVAEQSLKGMLECETLQGQRFLDVGSGSGLFSMAARNLGATVHSFDYDLESVACTLALRERYRPADEAWTIERGDVLDNSYLARLGTFDVVYSWGVLHHTGDMWRALGNLIPLVNESGQLYMALYNDQGRGSMRWARIKRLYNILPFWLRWLVLAPTFVRLWGPTTVRDVVSGRPFSTWRSYKTNRGMSPMIDVVDWVGGWPFEVAKPERVLDFLRKRGFYLERMKTCAGGHGCNEYVFRASSAGT